MAVGIEKTEASPETGLNAQQVQERVAAGLVNTAVKGGSKTVGEIIRGNLFTYFNLIFAVLTVLLILARSYKSLTFLPVVIANTVIGIVQEIRAKQVLDRLTVLSAPKARALRGGAVSEIPSELLVRDDIVVFGAGDQICADAAVVSGDAYVNESLLTGESVEIHKAPSDSLLSGSFVVSGECRARLEKVGAESFAAKLTLQAKAMDSKERSEMIRVLGKIVGAAGIIIIPVGLALFAQQFWLGGKSFSESIVSMVAAVIGMIPEGLYLLTSVALAVSMIRLAQRKVMLHDMKCIETLARVDVLCVDKTGTITEGRMKVAGVLDMKEGAAGCGAEGHGAEACDGALGRLIRGFLAAMPQGNITDSALREYFGMKEDADGCGGAELPDENRPGSILSEPDAVLPFSAAYKYAAASFGGSVYALGAPEFILKEDYEKFKDEIEKYSSQGFRVLLFAMADVGDAEAVDVGAGDETAGAGTEVSDRNAEVLKDLKNVKPLALILLENTIRENAAQTFSYFADQDVQIKVISGDNPVTVSRVAQQAGIAGAEKYVDAGTLKTEEDIAAAAEEYNVFGRVTPDQKRSLIRALKAAGHTVGMTGDGVNDVLALKDADCSVAMASGCEAAVDAAQMVLLDSDFAHMPDAVLEGRRVVNNIQRSASLFLVKNIFSLIAALFSILFAMRYPLIPSQVTLVAAFTIGAPGFFLALAPCKDRIKGNFLKNVLVRAIPAGITDALVIILLAQVGPRLGIPMNEISTACTVILAAVGLMILINICWPLNKMRVVLIIGCAVCMAAVGLILKDIFEICPLSGRCTLLLLAGLALSAVVLNLLILVSRRFMK